MTEQKKTGPGKGNRTRGKDRRGNRSGRPGPHPEEQQQGITAYAEDLKEMTEHYKKIAKSREKVNKYNQPFVSILTDRISEYIETQKAAKKPLTVSGMIRASGMSATAYEQARKGEYDHLLYLYMDIHGISYDMEGTEIVDQDTGEKVLLQRMSWPIKMGDLAIMEERESKCSENRGNPAGNIFLLKSQYGFRDDPEKITHNNTLVLNNVASLDEAKEALKRLNG